MSRILGHANTCSSSGGRVLVSRRQMKGVLLQRQSFSPSTFATVSHCKSTLWISRQDKKQVNSRPDLYQSQIRWSSSSVKRVKKPFILADIGEGIAEVEIVKWLVEVGQTVQEFDPMLEVQSDKATVEITSPFHGQVSEKFGQVGDTIKVGSRLCLINVEAEEREHEEEVDVTRVPSASAPASQTQESTQNEDKNRDVHSTPAVRRLAKEHNIDISNVRASGKGGRVTKEDVLAYMDEPAMPKTTTTTSATPTTTPVVPLTSTKKAMFKAMTNSLRIPHFAYSDEVDVTELERMRRRLNTSIPMRLRKTWSERDEVEHRGVERVDEAGRIDRVTMLSFMVKSLGWAMAEHSLFQCSLGADGALHRRDACDVSIALATQPGLFTPLVPHVDTMTVFDVASWIARLQHAATTAPAGQVPKFPGPDRSGTLTLSNVGVIGGTYTHPVIPPTGQLAIGAVGKMQVVPRYRPEHLHAATEAAVSGINSPLVVEPRLVVTASFTADHRVVEGVELARLVASWKRLLEQPSEWAGRGR